MLFWGEKNIDRFDFQADLKININSKIADCVEFHIENYNLLKIKTDLDIFSPQNSSVIYNYVFLYYLDCFQII